MAELDRPKRPQTEQTLLYELQDMSFDGAVACEEMIRYVDDLEEYCDDLDGEIEQLMGELGDARRLLATEQEYLVAIEQAEGLRETIKKQEEQIGNLRLHLAVQGMEEDEDEEREKSEIEQLRAQVAQQQQHIAGLSQELAFAQVKLGGIQLILR